ncbi:MAG TPA: c-type cytochrome biogenesis protein CcmI [Rhizomicrobium sp.]|jgi:cytochrome c-type biogenesis protein CcmH
MTLWIVLTVMIALTAAGLTIPLVRRYDSVKARLSLKQLLEAQLRDIDAQEAYGQIAPEEAANLRTDVKRRMLSEGAVRERTPRPIPVEALPWVALSLAAAVALSAAGIYAWIGRPDLSGAPARIAQTAPQTAPPTHPMGGVATMIDRLQTQLRRNPDDPAGWRMLGWSYLRTGKPDAAATAYAQAAQRDPKNPDYRSAEGEALVLAANGQVTAEALTAFKSALMLAPDDPRARYYLAVAKDQTGDHAGAMADWIALIKSAPANAPWVAEVRGFVERTAQQRHLDISKQLPPAQVQRNAGGQSSPTPDQMAAAAQMPDGDRNAMIHGMVDKLATELKQNPRDADGWVRLMRARMVLGEDAAAADAYRAAQSVFAQSPTDLAALGQAAHSLGVPGA